MIQKMIGGTTMFKKVYIIYDSCSGVYSPPMCYINDSEASREFSDAVLSGQGNIGKHPEHFSMYHIGTYDDAKGDFEPITREHIANAIEYLNIDNPNLEENLN